MDIINKALGISSFSEFISNDFYRPYLFQVTFDRGLDYSFSAEFMSSTSTPVSNTNQQIIDFMHTQIKQAGKTTVQVWNINVRDTLGTRGAWGYFNNWRELVHNFKKEIQPRETNAPKRYKRSADIQMITPSNNGSLSIENATRNYKLSGVWPMEIGAINLDYEASGICIFPVTLSIDYFTTSFGKEL